MSGDERYPALVIDTGKLEDNLTHLAKVVHENACSLMVVTKAFCAEPRIVDMLLRSGAVDYLADSRVQNLARYSAAGKKTVLLRLPQTCEIAEVVRHADMSLNSERETLRLLDAEAARQEKKHKVLLMIDLGDLREGIFFRDEKAIIETAREIQTLRNLEFFGVGTNLTCYGAVLPTVENLGILVDWAARIEAATGMKSAMVSGGNSSSYYLLERGILPEGVNNLRLGESFLLGNDTAWEKHIEGTHNDAITLAAQVIEVQTKPSAPLGITGVDAFGKHPSIKDRGAMRRALLALGRQDADPAGLTPLLPGAAVVGASSDHLILDVTAAASEVRVGGIQRFTLNYSALLRAFTSPYVARVFRG